MKVTDYVPQLYEKNTEMLALMNSEEQEFEESLKPAVNNSFNDTFAKTATINGIENYEKIFSITADPSTEDLEFRRARIFNRLISQIPFTERFLQNKLDEMLGKNTNQDFTPHNPNNNQWYYLIDYGDYTLDLYITVPGRSWLNEVRDFLERVIPCNIAYTINVYAASWQQVKETLQTWQAVKAEGTWQDVKDALWLT